MIFRLCGSVQRQIYLDKNRKLSIKIWFSGLGYPGVSGETNDETGHNIKEPADGDVAATFGKLPPLSSWVGVAGYISSWWLPWIPLHLPRTLDNSWAQYRVGNSRDFPLRWGWLLSRTLTIFKLFCQSWVGQSSHGSLFEAPGHRICPATRTEGQYFTFGVLRWQCGGSMPLRLQFRVPCQFWVCSWPSIQRQNWGLVSPLGLPDPWRCCS